MPGTTTAPQQPQQRPCAFRLPFPSQQLRPRGGARPELLLWAALTPRRATVRLPPPGPQGGSREAAARVGGAQALCDQGVFDAAGGKRNFLEEETTRGGAVHPGPRSVSCPIRLALWPLSPEPASGCAAPNSAGEGLQGACTQPNWGSGNLESDRPALGLGGGAGGPLLPGCPGSRTGTGRARHLWTQREASPTSGEGLDPALPTASPPLSWRSLENRTRARVMPATSNSWAAGDGRGQALQKMRPAGGQGGPSR